MLNELKRRAWTASIATLLCASLLSEAQAQRSPVPGPSRTGGGDCSERHGIRLSVKFILDSRGRRADQGNIATDEQLRKQIDHADWLLCDSGSSLSLDLVEIQDLPDLPFWFDAHCFDVFNIEKLAQADPERYLFRDDAVNIYVTGTTDCVGVCSFPHRDDHTILVGQSLFPTTLIHEIGHYFGLFHTHGAGDCTDPGDDHIDDTLPDTPCWDQDAIAMQTYNRSYDNLPASFQRIVDNTFFNIMSYHAIPGPRSIFTRQQAQRMLEIAVSHRSHVMEWFRPSRGDHFLRGDFSRDGKVDLTDIQLHLQHMFFGEGEVTCEDAVDVNDDGLNDIVDPLQTLRWLLVGQVSVPFPGAESCGEDPTEDDLGCAVFEGCGLEMESQ